MGSERPPLTDEQKEAMEAAFKEVAPIMRAERFEAGFRAGLASSQRAGEPPTPDEVERAATLEAALRHALSEAEAIATGAPEESHIPAYQEMALSIVLQARAALKAIR